MVRLSEYLLAPADFATRFSIKWSVLAILFYGDLNADNVHSARCAKFTRSGWDGAGPRH
jgi:hypothetical protein